MPCDDAHPHLASFCGNFLEQPLVRRHPHTFLRRSSTVLENAHAPPTPQRQVAIEIQKRRRHSHLRNRTARTALLYPHTTTNFDQLRRRCASPRLLQSTPRPITAQRLHDRRRPGSWALNAASRQSQRPLANGALEAVAAKAPDRLVGGSPHWPPLALPLQQRPVKLHHHRPPSLYAPGCLPPKNSRQEGLLLPP